MFLHKHMITSLHQLLQIDFAVLILSIRVRALWLRHFILRARRATVFAPPLIYAEVLKFWINLFFSYFGVFAHKLFYRVLNKIFIFVRQNLGHEIAKK